MRGFWSSLCLVFLASQATPRCSQMAVHAFRDCLLSYS
jgi:hypothetical protein